MTYQVTRVTNGWVITYPNQTVGIADDGYTIGRMLNEADVKEQKSLKELWPKEVPTSTAPDEDPGF